MNCVRKSINSICVVEWLSTKCLVKSLSSFRRYTVVNVGIRLNNPDKLLAWVVEVEEDRTVTATVTMISAVEQR